MTSHTVLTAGLVVSVAVGQSQVVSRPAIAFVSTRHEPAADPAADAERTWLAPEIYVMSDDGTPARRLTNNGDGDGFPALSPDGTRIVFDSNRRREPGGPFNVSDLFVMSANGSDQTFLIRGSSATWSPDGRQIAFHASASGAGLPIKRDPGAATADSDIFTLALAEALKSGAKARNLTNTGTAIDDDPDWSPDGTTIVFTSHARDDDPQNSATAEIFVIRAAGTGTPVRLTNNKEEERGPTWSPDGRRIAYACRNGGLDLEICVMNADGTSQRALTDNAAPDLTPSWSPDGRRIAFHRRAGGPGQFQLFVINDDGTGEKPLTFPPGINAFPDWGSWRGPGEARLVLPMLPSVAELFELCQNYSRSSAPRSVSSVKFSPRRTVSASKTNGSPAGAPRRYGESGAREPTSRSTFSGERR